MGRTNDIQRQEDLELIRRALIVSPRASLRNIQESISKEIKRSMSINYVNNLVNIIRQQRKLRYSEAKVQERVAEMEENFSILVEEMYMIINDSKASNKDRINAAKQIALMEKNLFDAQLDAGIFDRKLGEVVLSPVLDEEIAIPVLQAFKNFGLIKSVDIIDITPKKDNEQSNNNGNTSIPAIKSPKRQRDAKENGK